MSNRIEDEIKKANAFGDQIENLVIAKGQCPTGDRNTPLMAYWSLLFDFHRGVLCLLSHKFYGSAFALVRPIVEGVVRSHVVIMGSEDDVRKLREDEYRTNLSTVGKEIDTAFGTDDFFEKFLARARIALIATHTLASINWGGGFLETILLPTTLARKSSRSSALARAQCSW
jgi:hypothetical protein